MWYWTVGLTEFGNVIGQASETCPRDENAYVGSMHWVSPERNGELRDETDRSSGGTSEKCLVKASIMGV